MNKLKKPIFWSYFVLFTYMFFSVAMLVILGPYSIMMKSISSILGLLMIAAGYRFVMLPLVAFDTTYSKTPLPMLIVGLVQICLGIMGLGIFLEIFRGLQPSLFTPWQMYMNLSVPIMLPFGTLIFAFSILQLILNRRPT
jgi:hypothetical protein